MENKRKNVLMNRNLYIGGSDLPYILGNGEKYGVDIFEFAMKKAGLVPAENIKNQYTTYGDIMEGKIRKYINFVLGANYKPKSKVDAERKYRGNCDGLDENAYCGLLEIKTYGTKLDYKYYEAQCRFYMEVFNVDKCILVGYKRPKDFYWGLGNYNENYFDTEFKPENVVHHIFHRDQKKWEELEKEIKKFQRMVEKLREQNKGRLE